MSGFATQTIDHLIRSDLWTSQLKEVLQDELMGTRYVRMLSDFPDGDTFHVPSIGEMEAQNYDENQQVQYTAIDTGDFTFEITEYMSSATYVTNKMKQDSYVMSQIQAQFVPMMSRAIMVDLEQKLMALGPNGQTANNVNAINGARHRIIGSGTNDTISVTDFAKAHYALKKANVPMTNLVAIVDPSVEYSLNTLTNLVNVSDNPRWEGIVNSGFAPTGMRFIKNIFGFDVYVSNYLKQGVSETSDDGSVTNGVANLFFSAQSDVLPFVGAIRQAPKVDSEYNKDLQRDEYVTTMRYGLKLFRPENLVVVLTDNSQVYA
jgi:hypothetical protein